MFGHDNNDQKQDQQDEPAENSAVVGPVPDASLDETHTQVAPSGDSQGAPPVDDSTDNYIATPVDETPTAAASVSGDDTDNLLDIKQQALQQLSPLVDHLDQTPEEKFKTTMMMIQASDDKGLVKTAYEAAKAINDEKTRAQALLDVVNEINYFTHSSAE